MNNLMKRNGLRVALLACAGMVAVLGASCGSGGGGGGGGTPTPTPSGKPLGGTILALNGFAAGFGFSSATAMFFTTAAHGATSVDPFGYIALGSCVAPAAASTAGPPTSTYMSVGTAVNLVSGSMQVSLPNTPGGGGSITYPFAGGAGVIPGGTTWDVTLTGSTTSGITAQTWTGALVLPREAVVSTPAGFSLGGGPIHIPRTTPLTLVWSSSGSANAVVITFSAGGGGGAATQICRVADTGTFTVGTAALSQISANGTVSFAPYIFGEHDLNNSGVTITGERLITHAYGP